MDLTKKLSLIKQLLIKLQLRRHSLSKIGMELHIGAKRSLCICIGMPHTHLTPLCHVTQTSLIDLLSIMTVLFSIKKL